MRCVRLPAVCAFMLLAIAVCTTHGYAQAANPLTCGLPPTDAQCQVQLGAKDTVALVLVKPPADGIEREFAITSDRCCVDSSRVHVDGNGLVRIRWSAAAPPDTAVHIYVLVPHSTDRGVLTLLPAKAAETNHIEPAETSLETHYVWLRSMYVPRTVSIRISSIGGRMVVDQSSCEKVHFLFQPRVEGKATPDSGYARWIQNRNGSAGRCESQTRWKLGDASGQQMDVTLTGQNMQPNRLLLEGYGRVAPRVMGGLGKFRHIVRDRDVQCTSSTSHTECASKDSFPTTVTVTDRGNGFVPYGAVEFPLLFMSHYTGDIPEFVFRRVRLVGGTTLKHPEKNPFVGIGIMPLLHPSLEETPFQFTVGSTVSGRKYFFYGISVDANVIAKPLVGIFGLGS